MSFPSRRAYYCGVPPQTSWSLHDKGPMFVISLFDGIGAAFCGVSELLQLRKILWPRGFVQPAFAMLCISRMLRSSMLHVFGKNS